ncbi:hypothetical protein Pme01_42650 [Planosporangium mesophilum]|uniref:Uncharacterized protein n=1 Tax=Planosporangium mesophilum TaxID=689768 RepID=A0A8J3TDB0_9ACTN|nr:hypothetical protein Pme01_42650 [Planosporangium mesophilum]
MAGESNATTASAQAASRQRARGARAPGPKLTPKEARRKTPGPKLALSRDRYSRLRTMSSNTMNVRGHGTSDDNLAVLAGRV